MVEIPGFPGAAGDLDDGLDEEEGGEAQDLLALKDCLKALADAIASTNLAVIEDGRGDPAAATARVQASVAALKRFHEAFEILKQPADEDGAE